jgi:hypothetical protein
VIAVFHYFVQELILLIKDFLSIILILMIGKSFFWKLFVEICPIAMIGVVIFPMTLGTNYIGGGPIFNPFS